MKFLIIFTLLIQRRIHWQRQTLYSRSFAFGDKAGRTGLGLNVLITGFSMPSWFYCRHWYWPGLFMVFKIWPTVSALFVAVVLLCLCWGMRIWIDRFSNIWPV